MSIVNNVILLSVMCTACNANGELGQTRLNYVTRARSARLVVVNLAYLSDLTFEYSDLRVVVYYYS